MNELVTDTQARPTVVFSVETVNAWSVAKELNELCLQRQTIALDDTATRDAVLDDLMRMKAHSDAMERLFKAEKEPWLTAGREVDNAFRAPREFCEQAIAHLKKLVQDYTARAAAREAEERRKAEEEARKQREAEQREAARLEQKAREERQKREEQARKLEEQGRTEEAEQKRQAAEEAEAAKLREAQERRQAAEMAPPPVVYSAPSASKMVNVTNRTDWDYLIEDESKLPREYLIPNEKMIKGTVKAQKDKTNIPGVRVFPKSITSVRG